MNLMSDTWFYSDPHFGHKNISGFAGRPFDDVTEMDETLIANWNGFVAWDDTVWILGDLCMGRIEETLSYLRRLMGHKILLAGNHDRCWQGYKNHSQKDYHDWEKTYIEAGISEVLQSGAKFEFPTMEIAGETVWLSHFPFVGDSHEMKGGDKFSAYRPPDQGQFLLHGHTHSKKIMQDKMIHVGVDAWDLAPVHIDWVAQLIREYND